MNHQIKLLAKWLACLMAFVLVCICLVLGVMRADHNLATTLPVPTGSFAVGRTTYMWLNHAGTDKPVPGASRNVIAWIWYPSTDQTAVPADYLPMQWRKAIEQNRGLLVNDFLMRDLSRVQTHSAPQLQLATQPSTFPVVLMRTGGSTLAAEYATLAEDLASHGFIVVGFDVPYRTQIVVLPDGQVIKRTPANNPDLFSGEQLHEVANRLVSTSTADTAFVLDQLELLNTSDATGLFKGHLDLKHVGIFGHSIGGATALQFCHDDVRCQAGVDLDGQAFGSVVPEGLHKPFMFVLSDHSRETGAPDTQRIASDLKSIYDRLPANDRAWFVIPGSNHFGFSDGALLRSPAIQRVLQWVGIIGIDGRQQLAITSDYLHRFFEVYLKGASRQTLNTKKTHPDRY